ncbi:DUF2523 family protein [Dyella humicola]|uniref:DUF2523 family protein n=1 Tax=Dyella humicola TaxID=2992126 RepID=UPI0022580FFC|nr:DUF2523 family protein [Dyella humicola]
MGAAVLAILEVSMAALSRLIASRAGQWVLQILLFFGINFVSNKFAADPIKAGLARAFGGMTADVLGWVGFLQVDAALTIIISAYAAASLTNFAIQRMKK